MESIAGIVAPLATIMASLIIASNLGPRITGWGFVVHVCGAVCWLALGLLTGQTSLAVANSVLLVIDIFGIWRWLGRQASFQDGRESAARRSAAAHVPTLFSASALVGKPIAMPDGEKVASVVDAMLRCEDRSIAYIVASEGGIGGVGEQVRGINPEHLVFSEDGISTTLGPQEFRALPILKADAWPSKLPS